MNKGDKVEWISEGYTGEFVCVDKDTEKLVIFIKDLGMRFIACSDIRHVHLICDEAMVKMSSMRKLGKDFYISFDSENQYIEYRNDDTFDYGWDESAIEFGVICRPNVDDDIHAGSQDISKMIQLNLSTGEVVPCEKLEDKDSQIDILGEQGLENHQLNLHIGDLNGLIKQKDEVIKSKDSIIQRLEKQLAVITHVVNVDKNDNVDFRKFNSSYSEIKITRGE